MQKMRIAIFVAFIIGCVAPSFVFALDEIVVQNDVEKTYLARVVTIISSDTKVVPNTNVQALYQTMQVTLLDGDKKGATVVVEDSTFPVKKNDRVYVRYLKTGDGTEYYSLSEPYRLPALLLIVGIFFIVVLIFGGKQGFLALIGLFISFGVIFKILFPSILDGENIVFVATIGAVLSLFVVMYTSHGFTRLTTAAFLGCLASVCVTVLFAQFAVALTSLTGFSDEESVFLNLATQGKLDFAALLVGAIIIGVVGVIDDVAITQASVVHELRHANKALTMYELYRKASTVGKNHMGAVINTLVLAYAGASLPLVLLLYISDIGTLELINREAVATEIVRSAVGSVGLLCTVPLTTLIAIILMKGDSYVVAGDICKEHPHHHH